jgi:hypothetical protein
VPDLGVELVYVRFDHDVVSSSVAVWSSLAITGDARVDESRIDLHDSCVVHSILCERAGEVVLDEHITLLDQSMKDLDTSWMLEGET